MPITLYSIASELLELHNLREQCDCEGDAAAVKAIDAQIAVYVEQHLATKADGIRGYIRELEALSYVHKEEAARFAVLAKAEAAQAERVKSRVLEVMRQFDMKIVHGSKGEPLLRRRGNGGLKPLVIAQPELVPWSHKKVIVTMSAEDWSEICPEDTDGIKVETMPDNTEIRHTLERGEGVPGCRLEELGEHIRVE